MGTFVAILALLAGYVIGYSVCLREHDIRFDKQGRRIK